MRRLRKQSSRIGISRLKSIRGGRFCGVRFNDGEFLLNDADLLVGGCQSVHLRCFRSRDWVWVIVIGNGFERTQESVSGQYVGLMRMMGFRPGLCMSFERSLSDRISVNLDYWLDTWRNNWRDAHGKVVPRSLKQVP